MDFKCTKKKFSKITAMLIIAKYSVKKTKWNRREQRYYKCYCGSWHLTSQKAR